MIYRWWTHWIPVCYKARERTTNSAEAELVRITRSFVLLFLLGLSIQMVFAQEYKIAGSISIGGTGHWDYLLADSDSRRLYVSHTSEVVVVDLDSQMIVGKIRGEGFSHGIARANDLNRGFTADEGSTTSNSKVP